MAEEQNQHTVCLEFSSNHKVTVSRIVSDRERTRIAELEKIVVRQNFNTDSIEGTAPTSIEATAYAICDTLYQEGYLDQYIHDNQISLRVKQKGQESEVYYVVER